MEEININSLAECVCLDKCCFQKEKIKVYKKNNIIIISDGFNKKHGRFIENYFEYHRDDGPAIEIKPYLHNYIFRLEGKCYDEYYFAKETKHLICNSCNNFCNQKCFI